MPKSRRKVNPTTLRVLIARYQLRQYDVAKRADIPQPAVCQFLNERQGLSPERAERIAQAVRELVAERRGARASA